MADVHAAASGRMRALRLGFAWSALGRHTTEVLQTWRTENPAIALEIHRFDERAAGLIRAAVDVAVIRGPLDQPGIESRAIFTEQRMAALPREHPLAARDSVELMELADETVLTTATGTTTLDMWPLEHRPRSSLKVDNIDEWITEIAGGLAIGVTTESTSAQHAHPGVRFLPLRGAEPVTVYLAWPIKHQHPALPSFVALVGRIVSR
jgi:DNA-binding transcriptional LysR family regulator